MFSTTRLGTLELPIPPDRQISQEPLDGVNVYRLIELSTVARGLAGMVANTTHDRRQWIVFNQLLPGFVILSRFRKVQPSLDIFPRRASMVAGRKTIAVDGTFRAPGTGVVGETGTYF